MVLWVEHGAFMLRKASVTEAKCTRRNAGGDELQLQHPDYLCFMSTVPSGKGWSCIQRRLPRLSDT